MKSRESSAPRGQACRHAQSCESTLASGRRTPANSELAEATALRDALTVEETLAGVECDAGKRGANDQQCAHTTQYFYPASRQTRCASTTKHGCVVMTLGKHRGSATRARCRRTSTCHEVSSGRGASFSRGLRLHLFWKFAGCRCLPCGDNHDVVPHLPVLRGRPPIHRLPQARGGRLVAEPVQYPFKK